MSKFIGLIGIIPFLMIAIVFYLIRGTISYQKEIRTKRNSKNGQI